MKISEVATATTLRALLGVVLGSFSGLYYCTRYGESLETIPAWMIGGAALGGLWGYLDSRETG